MVRRAENGKNVWSTKLKKLSLQLSGDNKFRKAKNCRQHGDTEKRLQRPLADDLAQRKRTIQNRGIWRNNTKKKV